MDAKLIFKTSLQFNLNLLLDAHIWLFGIYLSEPNVHEMSLKQMEAKRARHKKTWKTVNSGDFFFGLDLIKGPLDKSNAIEIFYPIFFGFISTVRIIRHKNLLDLPGRLV